MRYDRLAASEALGDARDDGARDRDRILYSDPFRRLVGVTQVVGSYEGSIFHNRLTHSMKVGQIARRLAERLNRDSDRDLITSLGGLDPEVAEAAALAHDIGHPPFGHAGETVLDELVRERGLPEGFEGNAQSFRVVTKLAVGSKDPDTTPGLNLSRATLRGMLKYPWFRKLDQDDQLIPNEKASLKWSAYESERDEFEFALQMPPVRSPAVRSLEAEVMDWADDVTYAVHDLEDFYRAGLIPLPTLTYDSDARDEFIEQAASRADMTQEAATQAFATIQGWLPTTPFTGTAAQLQELAVMRSALITTLISAFSIDSEAAQVAESERDVAEILKQLTWSYVILSPDLASQQYGQRRLITDLFEAFCGLTEGRSTKPTGDFIRSAYHNRPAIASSHAARLTADYISSLTEAQALQLHGRITGLAPGSVRDFVV